MIASVKNMMYVMILLLWVLYEKVFVNYSAGDCLEEQYRPSIFRLVCLILLSFWWQQQMTHSNNMVVVIVLIYIALIDIKSFKIPTLLVCAMIWNQFLVVIAHRQFDLLSEFL